MSFGVKRFFSICALAACAAVASPASAQNTMSANVQNADVFDGISIEQLNAIFSASTLNGEALTIIERQTPEGVPYLAMTAPSLPMVIFISGVAESYSGEGDGVFAGASFFTTVNLNSITQIDVNEFNLNQKLVKLVPTGQQITFYAVDRLAAGGVTDANLISSLIPFLDGLNALATLASTQTVGFDPEASAPAIEFAVEYKEGVLNLNAPNTALPKGKMANTKILSGRFDDPNTDRMIAQFIESQR